MFDFLKMSSLKVLINSHKDVKKVADEVLDISLKNGKASSKIKLKGESEPLSVSFDYELDGDMLCITNVKTSKAWLDGLAELLKDKYARIDLSKHNGADKVKYFL
jgi:hypothetical protein